MVGITLELGNGTALFGHRLENLGGDGGWVKLRTAISPWYHAAMDQPIDASRTARVSTRSLTASLKAAMITAYTYRP